MTEENLSLSRFHEYIKRWEVSFNSPEANRLDVVVKAENLVAAVSVINFYRWGYLSSITGLDHPGSTVRLPAVVEKQWMRADEKVDHIAGTQAEGYLEALYQFVEGPNVGTLRVRVPYHNPTLPSLCGVIPSATLYERELIEMLGFYIPESPDQTHLILPEEWPAGVFPLRKDFQGLHPGKGGSQD
jgi:Ni,Fe-hydrogenase III component G